MSERLVGVLGAGTIGRGVAQVLAQSGHSVILLDVAPEALERARDEIRAALRVQRLFGKGGATETPEATLARIRFSTEYQLLAEAEVVIENVPESWELKREVYRQIDAICPPRCVFAANTSAIPITRLASATRRPAQVIGLHFMNPVPLKPVVEVIRGYRTSDETLETIQKLLARMGKEAIVVRDSPGFVANRVLMLTINEAIFLVHEQVAPAEEIDRLFKTCFGHAMGPLETADLIGLDTVLASIDVLYASFNDGKYRPCPLLREMVAAGLHGRKSGQGFYAYPATGSGLLKEDGPPGHGDH